MSPRLIAGAQWRYRPPPAHVRCVFTCVRGLIATGFVINGRFTAVVGHNEINHLEKKYVSNQVIFQIVFVTVTFQK